MLGARTALLTKLIRFISIASAFVQAAASCPASGSVCLAWAGTAALAKRGVCAVSGFVRSLGDASDSAVFDVQLLQRNVTRYFRPASCFFLEQGRKESTSGRDRRSVGRLPPRPSPYVRRPPASPVGTRRRGARDGASSPAEQHCVPTRALLFLQTTLLRRRSYHAAAVHRQGGRRPPRRSATLADGRDTDPTQGTVPPREYIKQIERRGSAPEAGSSSGCWARSRAPRDAAGSACAGRGGAGRAGREPGAPAAGRSSAALWPAPRVTSVACQRENGSFCRLPPESACTSSPGNGRQLGSCP
ncbi:putative uncharacterized protein ENSP00000383309 [Aquila chrysaetos chrysaetos]|uniref:putative uncharacterized protein ENSP00000383309 n=1 Tax=Aquila chrysaetos chrysaetos TaxID=223781 RepID=UPI0011772656|nr:putative uncharacterized protein ENSP00000383309 [Aquila chrysaetos chrysaetos]